MGDLNIEHKTQHVKTKRTISIIFFWWRWSTLARARVGRTNKTWATKPSLRKRILAPKRPRRPNLPGKKKHWTMGRTDWTKLAGKLAQTKADINRDTLAIGELGYWTHNIKQEKQNTTHKNNHHHHTRATMHSNHLDYQVAIEQRLMKNKLIPSTEGS